MTDVSASSSSKATSPWRPTRIGASRTLRWRPSPGCYAGYTTPPAGSTLGVIPGTTRWLTLRAGGSGIAVALIDFEFAAPGRPAYDLAQLARVCVPIEDDFDQARIGWRPADRPARLRLVADAYGLDRDGRAELLTAMDDAIDRIEAAVRRSVDAGDPNAIAALKKTGGIEKYDRRRRWWTDHHDHFAAALL